MYQFREPSAQLFPWSQHASGRIRWHRGELPSVAGNTTLRGELTITKEHSVMYPVDLLKVTYFDIRPGQHSLIFTQTRLQVISAKSARPQNGAYRLFRSILRTDGVLSLWRGLPSVIVGAGGLQRTLLNRAKYLRMDNRSGSRNLLRDLRNGERSFRRERQSQASSRCCW